MAAIKSSSIHLIVTFLLFLLPFLSISADPDFLQDFCVADLRARQTLNGFPCKPSSEVTSDDFFFDGLSKPGNTRNSFLAGATLGNVRTFPGLNTQGLSMNRVDFAPGGLNPAHIHPRATETGVVTEGKVLVGFVTTGNVYYSKVLTTGHMFVVPRGLVHFQLNVGKGKATIITAFNSQLPGTVRLNVNLFGSRPAIQSKMKSSSIHLIFGFLAFLLLPFLSISADPDMLQDFCVADLKARQTINGFPCKPQSEVNSHDFFFDGLTKPGNTGNSFGSAVTPGDVRFFPGINTLGLSMNRVDLAPGGLNPAHTHPRATETGVVIEGNVLVGFVTTDNVYYSKELTAGQMFVIPRGLVHFQLNIGKGKAMIITAFNSQQPGVVMLNVNLFGSRPSIPNEVSKIWNFNLLSAQLS